MELRSVEEARKNVEEFAIRLLNLMLEKKVIEQNIKELKKEFKEEGVPVTVVAAIVNKIKRMKKKTKEEIFEEETIQEWLERNSTIDDKIGQLISD